MAAGAAAHGDGGTVDVTVEARRFRPRSGCEAAFRAHDLDHRTLPSGLPIELFDSHGAGGVFYHERAGGALRTTRLADRAEALALLLVDLDGDDRLDIHVGNDFALMDQVWLRTDGGWTQAMPFRAISRNTMSLDAGDVDGDGAVELFAADMSPYSAALARHYLTVMMKMAERPGEQADRQVIANVLLRREADGRYRNRARSAGVAASGWSWSARLGDLDHDGALDLYVVNGMVGSEQFPYLPDGELVEENQAYRNLGTGRFAPAPEWALGSERGGRGMGMMDLDLDGDLDVVVNNLAAPAQLFENRTCSGAALQVDLRQSGANTRAIGAVVRLRTAAGVQRRDVRSASGYLFGEPQRVHFGVPDGAALRALEVRWPDGAVSTIDDPPADMLLTIRRLPA